MDASKHQQHAQEFKVSKRYSYYVFLLLFIIYLFDYADRMVIVSLFPYMKLEWGLTDTQCGWFSSIVSLMMTAFVFPVSMLVDRWSRSKTMGLMAVLWSIASAAGALTRNFTQLLTTRSMVGVGEAAYTAGGHAMIAAYFPEEKRSTMNGLFTAANPLGTSIGVILGGVIAVAFGWRYAFGILAIPGLIVAILFFWVKDYKTVPIVRTIQDGAQAVKAKMKVADILREFLHTPSLLFTYLGYVGNTFITTSLVVWLPTYFHRVEGLPMDKAGMKTAIPFLLAVFGAPFGGYITDKIRKKLPNARMIVPAITSFLTALFLFIGFSFMQGNAQYFFMILVGITCSMFAGGGSAVTQDVVHPGLRAISYSMAQFFMMLLGYSLSPIFIGFISDHYDLLTAFKVLPLFAVVAGVAFFIGSFYYVRDLNKVEKVRLEE